MSVLVGPSFIRGSTGIVAPSHTESALAVLSAAVYITSWYCRVLRATHVLTKGLRI